MRFFSLVATCLIFLASVPTPDADAAELPLSFVGDWELNEDLSESFEQQVRAAAQAARSEQRGPRRDAGMKGGGGGGMKGGGGGGMRGGGGGGMQGGRGGGGMGRDHAGEGRDPKRAGLEPPLLHGYALDAETLSITMTEGALRFDYGSGNVRRFSAGGGVETAESAAAKCTVKSKKDGTFVVKTKTESKIVVTERHALSPERDRLAIAITIELPRLSEPVRVMRIFDAVGDTEGSEDKRGSRRGGDPPVLRGS